MYADLKYLTNLVNLQSNSSKQFRIYGSFLFEPEQIVSFRASNTFLNIISFSEDPVTDFPEFKLPLAVPLHPYNSLISIR
jgi:hypothetical protein